VDVTSRLPLFIRRLILVHGDRAMCEAYGSINSRSTLLGTEYDTTNSATYIVKLVRVQGEWKIISLECIYDKDNLIPVITPPKEPLKTDFPRESYKCLGFILETIGGYRVGENLPRWDRPEQAVHILEKARDWVAKHH
jgi:hypothetical protein